MTFGDSLFAAAPKQTKEQELAMWRRRASYDPMKAALEGKKRQEEAKRQMLAQQQSKLPERCAVFEVCCSTNSNIRNGRGGAVRPGGGGCGICWAASDKAAARLGAAGCL